MRQQIDIEAPALKRGHLHVIHKSDQRQLMTGPGNVITWTSKVGEFVIVFKGSSPFGDTILESRRQEVSGTVPLNMEPTAFNYAVVLYYNGALVADDPSIIITERKTRGAKKRPVARVRRGRKSGRK